MRHTIQAPPFLPPQGFPWLPMMPAAPSGPAMPSAQGGFPGQGTPGMSAMPAMAAPNITAPTMTMPGFGGWGTPAAPPIPMALGAAPQGMAGMMPIAGLAPLGSAPPQGIPTPPGGWPTMVTPPGGPLSALSALQGGQPGQVQSRPAQGWTTGREES